MFLLTVQQIHLRPVRLLNTQRCVRYFFLCRWRYRLQLFFYIVDLTRSSFLNVSRSLNDFNTDARSFPLKRRVTSYYLLFYNGIQNVCSFITNICIGYSCGRFLTVVLPPFSVSATIVCLLEMFI